MGAQRAAVRRAPTTFWLPRPASSRLAASSLQPPVACCPAYLASKICSGTSALGSATTLSGKTAQQGWQQRN